MGWSRPHKAWPHTLSMSPHLQGKAVGSSARVGRERRDALAAVEEAREVGEAVLIALRLLFALPAHKLPSAAEVLRPLAHRTSGTGTRQAIPSLF